MPAYTYDTPVGQLTLAEENGSLTNLWFETDALPQGLELRETELLREGARQLAAYLAGELREFSLPLEPKGTEYERRVWALLQGIPYGGTATYGQLAARLGNPRAARAVGRCNNRNPLPIFIPCHRVIGADGGLTGYRGGLWMKERLLGMEKRL